MKLVSAFILTFLIFFEAYSQRTVYETLNFGLKGGVNVSGLHGSYQDSLNTKYKVGLHFGLYTKYFISDDFSAGFELNFTRKGFKADVSDTATLGLFIYTHNYYQIEFPVFLEYRFAPKTSVELGASYALTVVNEKVNLPAIRPFEEDNSDITGFLGMYYDVDELTQLGFRYSYGINPIINTATKEAYSSNFQVIFRIRLL